MRRAVAVAGVPGQVRALDGGAGGRARQRSGVDQPHQVVPGRGVTGQFDDHRGEQAGLGAQPLAEPGLARDRREHCVQMFARPADPAALAGDPQQLLGHRQAHQLRHPTGPAYDQAGAPVTSPGPAAPDLPGVRTVRSGGCLDCSSQNDLGHPPPTPQTPTPRRSNRTHSSSRPDELPHPGSGSRRCARPGCRSASGSMTCGTSYATWLGGRTAEHRPADHGPRGRDHDAGHLR